MVRAVAYPSQLSVRLLMWDATIKEGEGVYLRLCACAENRIPSSCLQLEGNAVELPEGNSLEAVSSRNLDNQKAAVTPQTADRSGVHFEKAA